MEVGGALRLRLEVKRQRSEVRSRRSEVGGRREDVGGWRSASLEVGGKKTEIGGQKSEIREQKTEDNFGLRNREPARRVGVRRTIADCEFGKAWRIEEGVRVQVAASSNEDWGPSTVLVWIPDSPIQSGFWDDFFWRAQRPALLDSDYLISPPT